jgi:phospholipase C
MKHFHRTPVRLFLAALAFASCAAAQTIPANTFKHIIIIVQENRTPDNLFGYWATGQPSGAGCTPSSAPFTGADIYNGGYTLNSQNQQVSICKAGRSSY